jgi:hypothetical protein
MLRKLILFAFTSGLVSKAFRAYRKRERRLPNGLQPIPLTPPQRRTAWTAEREGYRRY